MVFLSSFDDSACSSKQCTQDILLGANLIVKSKLSRPAPLCFTQIKQISVHLNVPCGGFVWLSDF